MKRADLLLKDPVEFQKDLLLFALDRDFSLRDPFLLRRVLASGLKPEMLSPPEFFGMLADPSFGLCDPKLVGKVFDGTKENLTKEEIEVRPTGRHDIQYNDIQYSDI